MWSWRRTTRSTLSVRICVTILEEYIVGEEDRKVVLDKKSDVGMKKITIVRVK